MVHAPWGYPVNRTNEVRHNWLNSYPVLMTSLWEPKSSSVETGAIHQVLNKCFMSSESLAQRVPSGGKSSVFVITALHSGCSSDRVFNGLDSSGESIDGFVDDPGESRRPLS